jgi:uncharacterized protein YkwD
MSRYLAVVAMIGMLLVPSFRSVAHAASTTPRQNTTTVRIVELANAQRVAVGLKPLTPHPVLMAEAQRFSVIQANLGTLSHRGNDGTNAGQRLTQAGYRWGFFGENLAAGQRTPEAVVSAWMRSPTHRAVLLSPKATQIGVGHTHHPADPSRYVDYYVMEIGRPR